MEINSFIDNDEASAALLGGGFCMGTSYLSIANLAMSSRLKSLESKESA